MLLFSQLACIDLRVPSPRLAADEAPTVLLAPASGRPVPTNLHWLVVADESTDAVSLDGKFVAPVPLWDDDSLSACAGCRVVVVGAALMPNAQYDLHVGERTASFQTGDAADLAAPVVTTALRVSDGCAVLRLVGDEPVWVVPAVSSTDSARLGVDPIWPSTQVEVSVDLHSASSAPTLHLAFRDLADNQVEATFGPLENLVSPQWAISEVLSNPAGPEPTQEWVEILRLGSGPGSLAGFRIGDESATDSLPEVIVEAGQRALAVPAGFNEHEPSDVSASSGTPIVRIRGGTLGESGLANGGETVLLLDPVGRIESAFTPSFDASSTSWSGRSLERIRPAGCDVRANVAPNQTHSATPGAVNSVER